MFFKGQGGRIFCYMTPHPIGFSHKVYTIKHRYAEATQHTVEKGMQTHMPQQHLQAQIDSKYISLPW